MTEYHKNLIHILELGEMPAEAQEQLISEVEQILEVRVLNRAYDTLSDPQAEELDGYIQEADPEKVMTFLQDSLPNMSQIFEEEIVSLKEELAKHKQEMLTTIQKELQDLEK